MHLLQQPGSGCDASDDNNWVYLDDVVISGCNISARKGSEPVITEIPENLKLYPNPVTDKFTIENAEQSGIVKLKS